MRTAIDWEQLTNLIRYRPDYPLLFSTAEFFVLFILFYGGYLALLRKFNWRILYTLAFSLFFYYQSSGWFFFLLIASTLVDFGLGHCIYISKEKARKRFYLILSLVANLGMLGYFKYTNFLLGSLNEIIGSNFAFQNIFLPVGISFFTFQTLSYSIDIYRGQLVPLTADITGWRSFWQRLLDFGFFVSFFPQLVAGPIVRASDFIPQIRRKPRLSKRAMGQAFLLIMGGLFKKAVISDYISINFVDRVFESPMLYSGFENLLAAYGYAIQIYCDFSGYSDMAIGLALLMGFILPENFRRPYQAFSLQDFWRRWHISLSTWLRDYLYISMGGNRKGKRRTYLHLMVTMLLGGLWHGASWVFIIWGGLHGLGLAFERALRQKGTIWNPALRSLLLLSTLHLAGFIVVGIQRAAGTIDPMRLQNVLLGNSALWLIWILLWLIGWLIDVVRQRTDTYPASHVMSVVLIFHFVTFGWVFFRAGALHAPLPPLVATQAMLSQIMGSFNWALIPQVVSGYQAVAGLIALGLVLHYVPRRFTFWLERTFTASPIVLQSMVVALVIWIVIQTTSSEVVPFIYFQF